MSEELATTTYSVSEPFDQAVRSLRKALADGKLKLAGELDMSSRIRQKLLIGIAPCRVLFVTAELPAEPLDCCPSTAALTPFHLVVSARGSQTEIHFLRALPNQNGPMDQPMMTAFRHLQARITQAVERIGMRSTLVA